MQILQHQNPDCFGRAKVRVIWREGKFVGMGTKPSIDTSVFAIHFDSISAIADVKLRVTGHATQNSPCLSYRITGTYCAYPGRDGRAELAWVAGDAD